MQPLFRRDLFSVLFLSSCVMPVIVAVAQAPTSQPAADRPIARIAFGSCAQQTNPQPIWDAINAAQPDLFIFCGDNIYGDTENMDSLRYKYSALDAIPGFAKLRSTTPILATWDDHDYGENDAGAEYAKKKESQQVFLDFFGEPADSPRRKRAGVYDAKVFGPAGKRVQIILLDTRYFRSPLKTGASRGAGTFVPNPDPAATILGDAQWAWLREQLKVDAQVRVLVSSIQVIADEHGFEKWGNFPLERERLLAAINESKANGLIIISGDRHSAELSKLPPSDDARKGLRYPLYDVTSSAINQPRKRTSESNRHRIGDIFWLANFGMISIDWSQPDPAIRLEIRNVDNLIVIQQDVRLGELTPRN